MKFKSLVCSIVAVFCTSPVLAQKAANSAPQHHFLLQVPLDLKSMPGEIVQVAVWCTVFNGVYRFPAGGPVYGTSESPKTQPKLFETDPTGPEVIAETGVVLIDVVGSKTHGAQGRFPLPSDGEKADPKSASAYPAVKSWNLENIGFRFDNIDRKNDKLGFDWSGTSVPPSGLSTLASHFGGFTTNAYYERPDGVRGFGFGLTGSKVLLVADAPPGVNPALGRAYQCQMAFSALANISGVYRKFSVFGTDASSYFGMPTPASAKAASQGGAEARPGGIDSNRDTDRQLKVWGNFSTTKS